MIRPLRVLGAYAAIAGLSEPEGRRLLRDLAGNGAVDVLESPVDRTLPDWIVDPSPADTDLVFTLIGGAVRRLGSEPQYGLASPHPAARADAIDDAAHALEQVKRANDRSGRSRVRAVELHSAPPGGEVGGLADSLETIAGWDWEGAQLTIEHCDAPRPGPTAKGFLELDEEIEAICRSGTDVGVVINWGRSAIEGRSVETPIEHARQARAAGLLTGIVFSGCTDRDDHRGGAWADFHLPVADSNDPSDPSLLTPREIRRTLAAACAGLAFVGVKVSCGPQASIDERALAVNRSVRAVDAALQEAVTVAAGR